MNKEKIASLILSFCLSLSTTYAQFQGPEQGGFAQDSTIVDSLEVNTDFQNQQNQDNSFGQLMGDTSAVVKDQKKVLIPVIVNCQTGNCQNGKGYGLEADGSRYKGDFMKGVYQGYGEKEYANGGGVYYGGWLEGKRHGHGEHRYRNGHIETGVWAKGKFTGTKRKVWALVVGVADYPHISKLKYTKADARKVYGFLRSPEGGGIPKDQIILLEDEEATGYNIIEEADMLFSKASEEDLIIFYYAGHGKQGALLPYDYDGSNNLLHLGVINSVLKDSDAKYKLCMFDACHSGSFDQDEIIAYEDFLDNYYTTGSTEMPGLHRSTNTIRKRIKKFYKSFENVRGGMAVVMSSASEEISLETERLKQGVFSFYFMKGLKGHADADKDGIVEVQELFNFMDKYVRKYTYGFQHPAILGTYDENMPVGISTLDTK